MRISAIYYPCLIEQKIKVQSITDKKLYFDFVDSKFRLYYGKTINFVKNGNWYTGKYHEQIVGDDISYYIDCESISGIVVGDVLSLYETFKVSGDNKPLTKQDIHEQMESIPAGINFEGQTSSGSDGLLTSYDKYKIDNLLTNYKKQEKITLKNTYQELINLKVNGVLDKYSIILIFPGNGILSGDFIFEDNAKHVSFKVNSSTVPGGIKIKLTKREYETSQCVRVEFKLNNNVIYDGILGISAKSHEDFTIPITPVLTNTEIKVNGTDTEINADEYLSYIDSYGIQTTVNEKETEWRADLIKDSDDLSTLSKGFYYKPTNVTSVKNIPKGLVEGFIFELFANQLTSCRLISKTGDVYLGVVNAGTKNITWKQMSIVGHKHNAIDIIESTDRRFVTDIQIKRWDDAATSSTSTIWRPSYVKTKAALNSLTGHSVGWTVIVEKDETNGNKLVIYSFDGIKWVPQSIGGLKVDSTTEAGLVSPELLAKINSGGLSKKILIGDKTYYVHSDNQNSIYESLSLISVIDLVKRTSLKKSLGNNSINLGFGETYATQTNSIAIGNNVLINEVAGLTIGNDNSGGFITLGTGLLGNTNQLLIGKFNKVENGWLLLFGGGSSDVDRKNIFGINQQGHAVADGFTIPGALNTDILMGNGSTMDSGTLATKADLELSQDIKADKESHVIIELIGVDNSNTKLYSVIVPESEFIEDEDEGEDEEIGG